MKPQAARDAPMRIGELARRAGLSREAIRFYERERLLPAPRRLANNYRIYPADTLEQLRFIHSARKLGLSLEQIREALPLRLPGRRAAPGIQRLLEAQLATVDEQLARLRALRRELRATLRDGCQTHAR